MIQSFRENILAFRGDQCKNQETALLGTAKGSNMLCMCVQKETPGNDFPSSGYVLCSVPGERGQKGRKCRVWHFEINYVPLLGCRSFVYWKHLLQGEIFSGANESQAVGSCLHSVERRRLPPKSRVANLPSEMTLSDRWKSCCHWAPLTSCQWKYTLQYMTYPLYIKKKRIFLINKDLIKLSSDWQSEDERMGRLDLGVVGTLPTTDPTTQVSVSHYFTGAPTHRLLWWHLQTCTSSLSVYERGYLEMGV